jgi:hypothetical protein
MQQHRISKREALKETVGQGDPAETTRELTVIASVLAMLLVLTALSPSPVNLRAPSSPSARCIITPISIETGPTYLCES